MSEENFRVMAYAGNRGEEIPRAFMLGGRRIEVVEIQDRWIEEGLGDRATKRFFKVKGSDGGIHKIFYDEKAGEWYRKR